MLGPLGHLGSLVGYLATARRQHASDRTCARQLAWSGSLPPGLELTWLGTAGFRLAYQGTVVWIDPYVTRLSLRDLLARRVVPPSEPAIAAFRPLDAPLQFSLNVDLTGFADEVHRASRDLPIATLEVGARIGAAAA